MSRAQIESLGGKNEERTRGKWEKESDITEEQHKA
jgi:hypothetical protein